MHRFLGSFALFVLLATAAGAADIVVYDDSTQAGFDQTCSFGGTASDFDFANSAPTHTGSPHSIRFTPEQYDAVSWCKTSGLVSATTDFPSITFWVYLTSSAQGANLDLVLNDSSTSSYFPASLQSIYGSPIAAGTWVQLHTVFATGPMNYGGSFDHISVQDETGLVASDTVFRGGFDAPLAEANAYFDDVVLQSAATVTYTVSASAPGGNGSISPASQIVAAGNTASFTVTPSTGYHVTSVTGDHCTATQQGATTTWLTNAITQPCTVTATFAINTYTVTPSAGAGGTLTPSTPQTVNYNATANFAVGVNANYHVVSVTGCGGALAANTYTTGAITANCTVTATFASDTPPSCGLIETYDVTVAGMKSDTFSWCDSAGKPRSASLAHNDEATAGPGGSRGGEMRQFTYQVGAVTRTVNASSSGTAGFGYPVSHPGSDSMFCTGAKIDNTYSDPYDGNGLIGHLRGGSFTRVFEGSHHAIFRFTMTYPLYCSTANTAPLGYLIPVTMDWVFADGHDNPIWSITWDLSGAPVNKLEFDSRAPYGELLFDGSATEAAHSAIAGVAWGDAYKFTTTSSPVTYQSSWTWNTPNTIPYVKLWTTDVDATMGTVQTQPITQQDAGGYFGQSRWNTTSAAGNACAAGVEDPTFHAHSMPCNFNWDYQSINYSMGESAYNGSVNTDPTKNTRLAWGTEFGFLGQSAYHINGSSYWGGPLADATRSGYPKKSYSTYIVLGQHSTSPVETQVTQVETVQSLTLSATTGSVVNSGPAGINRADTIAYAPAGYDHVYGALAFNAASNALDANINVGSGTLKKPLIIVHNYTGASYPASMKLNGSTLVMDTDYFPSLRGNATDELWITLAQDLSGATNHLEINTSAGAAAHWVDGYHVGYESGDLPTNQINFNDITHLMVGAIVPNADGTLNTTFDIDAVNGPAWAQAAITAAHSAGRKAILMIGGAGSITGWRGAASNANRATFVTNLLNAVNTYSADGLDIDWEPTTDNNATNSQITTDHSELAALVQALRTNGPAGLLLTMPVGAYNSNDAPAVSEQTLFTTITPLLDQINLMSYSMAYDYPGWYSWFASALTDETVNTPLSVSSSITYYQGLGVPNAKLGVGIGFYGICFNNVTQPRQDLAPSGGYIASGDDNVMTYAHIASAYIPNMTYTYDSAAKAPWLAHVTAVAPEGCTYITYENATSIADKGAWVSAHSLGGTIIWTLAKGHLGNGNDPLMDATHSAFP